jgi:hypothetical protein
VNGHRSFPVKDEESLSCGHHVSLCVEPHGLGTGAICELCAIREQLHVVAEYATALERLRRHKRTIRENKCPERDKPCWIDLIEGSIGMDEMCDPCLMREVERYFRKEALKDVGRLRRKIERDARNAVPTNVRAQEAS